MSNKPLERSSMSTLVEAQTLIQSIAGDRGTSKERILRAARKLPRFSFNRVRELFYGIERCHVWAEELDELRHVARARQEENARSEYAELRERLAQIETQIARLAQTDEDFYRPQADALRKSADGFGGVDRTVD